VIEPVIATTQDVLEVVLVTESVDSDGDEVSYEVSWFQDESERTDLTDWTVPAGETSRGERWEVRVVASDASSKSGVAQAWVEIDNSEPAISSLSLSPESPRTSDALELEYQVEDADGDPVEVSFVWTVDDEETWHVEPGIPAHATARGQTWQVLLSVSDGTDQGASESAMVTIGNTPPPAPLSVTVLPSEPTTEDAIRCQVESELVDVDGESIGYSVAWLADGQLFTDAESETLPGDTVLSSSTTVGQVWSCAATPTDGSDEGESGASEPVEILESVPTESE